MKRILVSVPSYDGRMRIELASFFIEAGQYEADIEFLPVMHRPTDVARNMIVRYAQMTKRNIIMVDADAIPKKETFKVLADKICSEVCVAACPYVANGGHICVGETSPKVKEVENLNEWKFVSNCGTHTIGYNLEVFDAIKKPYFNYEYTDEGMLKGYAEDTVCHRKLRNAGVPIYIHWGYWSTHITDKVWDKPRTLTLFERQLILDGE